MHKPHLAESYRKELIATLQAKGKLPKERTVADERREAENNNTPRRIFPGPYGQDAVLDGLVAKATARIDSACKHLPPAGEMSSPSATGRCTVPPGGAGKRDPKARVAIEARLAQLELEIKSERERRYRLEGQVSELRESISRGGQ